MERVERGGIERLVDAAPRDIFLVRRFADEELVVRRPAGVRAGAADQRPFCGKLAFLTLDRLFVKDSGAEIPVDVAGCEDAD
jgi:hypothetical protein